MSREEQIYIDQMANGDKYISTIDKIECGVCGETLTIKENQTLGSLVFKPTGITGEVPQGGDQELTELCSICSRVVSYNLFILIKTLKDIKREKD